MCWCCYLCGYCLCSLGEDNIGAAGASAMATGLVQLAQLQTLEYVVRPSSVRGFGVRFL
jgi:hypothetical protein